MSRNWLPPANFSTAIAIIWLSALTSTWLLMTSDFLSNASVHRTLPSATTLTEDLPPARIRESSSSSAALVASPLHEYAKREEPQISLTSAVRPSGSLAPPGRNDNRFLLDTESSSSYGL